MLPNTITINGQKKTQKEFLEMCKQDKHEKIIHIVESHNSMEWVTDGELYFEDIDVAYGYYEVFHNGYIDELTPINPNEIIEYANSDTQIITEDILEKMIEEKEQGYNDERTFTQYDEDNAIYLSIIREGLGL